MLRSSRLLSLLLAAAVLALTNGEVDFMLNSLGLQRGLQSVFVTRMIERAADANTPDDVRAVIEMNLQVLQRRLVRRSANEGPDAAHDAMLARLLDRFLNQHAWGQEVTVTVANAGTPKPKPKIFYTPPHLPLPRVFMLEIIQT